MAPTSISMSIVTYNHEATIGLTLQSLTEHWPSGHDLHVWLIDNGSTDRTISRIEPYLSPMVSLVHSPAGNIGFGRAHNLILDSLASDYHIIMNPDVILTDPDTIPILCQYLDEHPEDGMAVPRILDPSGSVQAVYRRELTILDLFLRLLPGRAGQQRRRYHTLQDMDYSQPFALPFASGCFMMVRTRLLRHLGGFDERFFLYAEDADLTRRVNQISRAVYVPDATILHLWQRGSYRSPKLAWIHILSLVRYFRKWGVRWR